MLSNFNSVEIAVRGAFTATEISFQGYTATAI